jgi:hypothetical protein
MLRAVFAWCVAPARLPGRHKLRRNRAIELHGEIAFRLATLGPPSRPPSRQYLCRDAIAPGMGA